MSAATWTSLGIVALLLAAGCFGGLGRTPPTKQRFVLEPTAPEPSASDGTATVLRVARVRVSPVFDNKGFVYRTGPSTFETDFYNEFFSPPGILLRETLLQWLNSTGVFLAVARQSGVEAEWVLETDVEQLFADQRDSSAPQATAELAFRLLEARTRKLAFERRYSATETASAATPAALVVAWNRGLGKILRELAADVRPMLETARTSVRSE